MLEGRCSKLYGLNLTRLGRTIAPETISSLVACSSNNRDKHICSEPEGATTRCIQSTSQIVTRRAHPKQLIWTRHGFVAWVRHSCCWRRSMAKKGDIFRTGAWPSQALRAAKRHPKRLTHRRRKRIIYIYIEMQTTCQQHEVVSSAARAVKWESRAEPVEHTWRRTFNAAAAKHVLPRVSRRRPTTQQVRLGYRDRMCVRDLFPPLHMPPRGCHIGLIVLIGRK